MVVVFDNLNDLELEVSIIILLNVQHIQASIKYPQGGIAPASGRVLHQMASETRMYVYVIIRIQSSKINQSSI